MVTTQGFLTGIDSTNARGAYVAGGARPINEFWQAAGRAGQDGRAAHGHVLFHEAHLRNANRGEHGDEGPQRSFIRCAQSEGHSLRHGVESYLEGMKEPGTYRFEGLFQFVQNMRENNGR